MIRERRPEDLDRLSAILEAMEGASSVLAGRSARRWLGESDAEQSWVFDQAPVRVTPTQNVVGHIQIVGPPPGTDELMVITRLFVKPGAHDHNIARFLLKQAVRRVREQGRTAAVDPREPGFLPESFYERHGFVRGPDQQWLIARPDR